MHRAFARNLMSLNEGDIAVVDNVYREFRDELVNARGIVGINEPKTSNRFGLISQAQLNVLTEVEQRYIYIPNNHFIQLVNSINNGYPHDPFFLFSTYNN